MSNIPLNEANFLALVLETLVYGVFCLMFVASVYALTRKCDTRNLRLLATVVAMFVLCSAHLVVVFYDAFQALFRADEGALLYYADLSNPLESAKISLFTALMLVGDSFLIYRCWVVWGHRWWIVLPPGVLLIGTGVSGYASVWALSQAVPGDPSTAPSFKPFVTATTIMTLATNLLGTFLIAVKILRTQHRFRRIHSRSEAVPAISLSSASASALPWSSSPLPTHTQSHIHPNAPLVLPAQSSAAQAALTLIIESAAVYSATVVVYMITYFLNSNGQFIVLNVGAPIIGVVFTAIVLRVSFGMAVNGEGSSSHGLGARGARGAGNVASAFGYGHRYGSDKRGGGGEQPSTAMGMTMSMVKEVHRRVDSDVHGLCEMKDVKFGVGVGEGPFDGKGGKRAGGLA